jgi:hypothetical protein
MKASRITFLSLQQGGYPYQTGKTATALLFWVITTTASQPTFVAAERTERLDNKLEIDCAGQQQI